MNCKRFSLGIIVGISAILAGPAVSQAGSLTQGQYQLGQSSGSVAITVNNRLTTSLFRVVLNMDGRRQNGVMEVLPGRAFKVRAGDVNLSVRPVRNNQFNGTISVNGKSGAVQLGDTTASNNAAATPSSQGSSNSSNHVDDSASSTDDLPQTGSSRSGKTSSRDASSSADDSTSTSSNATVLVGNDSDGDDRGGTDNDRDHDDGDESHEHEDHDADHDD